jgi:hypothetical protein
MKEIFTPIGAFYLYEALASQVPHKAFSPLQHGELEEPSELLFS